jgi:hypothetical protein
LQTKKLHNDKGALNQCRKFVLNEPKKFRPHLPRPYPGFSRTVKWHSLMNKAAAWRAISRSSARPIHLGIALAMIDGHVYEVGDSAVPFTIQSISKAFVFAFALETLGADRVESKIGVEPSGEAFNSIRLRPDKRPFNPMVNAGHRLFRLDL